MTLDPTRWRQLVADMPLALIDTETTGKDAAEAGVCELGVSVYTAAEIEAAIAASRFGDPNEVDTIVLPEPSAGYPFAARFNPGKPISPGAMRTHGIRDEDVAGCPTIDTYAGWLGTIAASCRVTGYNSRSYDLPILHRLTGAQFPHALDVMGVVQVARDQPAPEGRLPWNCGGPVAMLGFSAFKNKLESVWAALRGVKMTGAHGAIADCKATADVLFLLLALFPGIPADGPTLVAAAERALCMVRAVNGVLTFVVGKHEETPVVEVELEDPGYLGWLLDEDTVDDASKSAVIEAIGDARASQILQQRRQRSPAPKRGRKPKETPGAAAAV